MLPSRPTDIQWLTPIEKSHLLYNLKLEQGIADDVSEIGKWEAFKLTVVDPKTWLLMGTLYATYTAAAGE